MNETTRIKIKVTERETKDTKKKFNTYKTFSKNGRATEVKFRQDVRALPKEDGFYTFNVDDMNLNTTGAYPVLWIRDEYVDFTPMGKMSDDDRKKNAKKIADFFGSDSDEGEDEDEE